MHLPPSQHPGLGALYSPLPFQNLEILELCRAGAATDISSFTLPSLQLVLQLLASFSFIFSSFDSGWHICLHIGPRASWLAAWCGHVSVSGAASSRPANLTTMAHVCSQLVLFERCPLLPWSPSSVSLLLLLTPPLSMLVVQLPFHWSRAIFISIDPGSLSFWHQHSHCLL